MEVVQLLRLQGFWQHQVLSWRLGQQEIQCSRRVWQPVLAHTLQYSCLEKPPDREAWQAIVYRVAKSWTGPKRLCMHRRKIFLPVATLPPCELSANVTQLLGFGGHQRLRVFKDTDCSVPGVMPLSEYFFKPFLADQKPSLAGFSP